MKGKVYRRPVSVLVAIYAQDMKRMLVLQWRDDPDFWRSATDSAEEGETMPQAAMRKIKEEVTIDVAAEQLTLVDCQRTVEFEIFSHLRYYYAPGVMCSMESWFYLAFPRERQIVFTEHLAYRWLNVPAAAALVKSWSSR